MMHKILKKMLNVLLVQIQQKQKKLHVNKIIKKKDEILLGNAFE
jgi:hypothetical protein